MSNRRDVERVDMHRLRGGGGFLGNIGNPFPLGNIGNQFGKLRDTVLGTNKEKKGNEVPTTQVPQGAPQLQESQEAPQFEFGGLTGGGWSHRRRGRRQGRRPSRRNTHSRRSSRSNKKTKSKKRGRPSRRNRRSQRSR